MDTEGVHSGSWRAPSAIPTRGFHAVHFRSKHSLCASGDGAQPQVGTVCRETAVFCKSPSPLASNPSSGGPSLKNSTPRVHVALLMWTSGQLCSRLEPWPCLTETLFCPVSAVLRTVAASYWRLGGGGARSSGPEPGALLCRVPRGRIFLGRASTEVLEMGLQLLAGTRVFRSGGCSHARH